MVWLLRGSFATAAIILGLAMWSFGFSYYFAYTTSGRTRPRREYDATGVTMRPQKIADVAFGVSTAAIFLAAVLYLIFAPLNMVDYGPTGVMRVIVPASCISLVLFGAPTLYRMLTHGGGHYLRLTPSTIEIWNGQWGTSMRANWEELENILDQPSRGSKPFNEVVVLALSNGRSAMLVADAMTGNPRPLREWVRFDWQHPEFRAELTDAHGLQRLDEEGFTPE